MSRLARRPLASLVLILVAACSAATSPVPRLPSSVPDRSGAPAPAGRDATPTPPPRATDAGARAPAGLAAELEIDELGPPFTNEMLEFASDGGSIIWSSGLEPDAGTDAAPDLFRLTPGPSATPELVWRNPERDHSIVRLGGDPVTLAWVEMPITGERAWNLWLRHGERAEPILLDAHPGDEDVPSLVPSFTISEDLIAWTSFDAGPTGPRSRLLVASAPGWTPRVVADREAGRAELWLPSVHGTQLAFTEVVYAPDRRSDERHVHVMDLTDPATTRRLDDSGLATMPLSVDGAVLWKEAEPGFNMFNWGRMFRHDLATGETRPIGMRPQEYVNYPSVGSRFVAWWGADSTQFGVYDLVRGHPRLVESHPRTGDISILRPHVAGDLLVWLEVDRGRPDDENAVLRFAFLPNAKEADR